MGLLFILKIDVEICTVIINSSTVVDTRGSRGLCPAPSPLKISHREDGDWMKPYIFNISYERDAMREFTV